MPIKKAGIKAMRSSKTNRSKNLKQKNNLKQVIKKATAKNLDIVYKTIDKAAKNNLIHANKASRLKSKITKKVSTTTTATAKPKKATKAVKTTKKVKKTKK